MREQGLTSAEPPAPYRPRTPGRTSAFPYSRAERRADAAVHALGLAFVALAAPALITLAALRADLAVAAAVALYAATLVAMIAASAAYHLNRDERWRETLRRMDHGAIYLKIAGTYTPFAAASLPVATGGWLMAALWGLAGVGVALKLGVKGRLERAAILLYLAMGWAGVLVWGDMSGSISARALTLLGAGGALYTLGVVFHLWERLPFHNAIWHLHVLVATVLMFAAVAVETL